MNDHHHINDEHRANLSKLADYLAKLPANYRDFDMSTFGTNRQGFNEDPAYTRCGTIACAAGHGPMAGIGQLRTSPTRRRRRIGWHEYIEENFGLRPIDTAWSYLFSGSWTLRDNSHHGAAARIRRFLDRGLPDPECFWEKASYASYLEDIKNAEQREPEKVS